MHGEQGSDWGEDESQFEWLDADEPEAVNGTGKAYNISPSKRLQKLKAAIGNGVHHGPLGIGQKEEGKKLKKALVFPRRAPPPPPPGIASHPNSPQAPSAPFAQQISHSSVFQPKSSQTYLSASNSRRPSLQDRLTKSDKTVSSVDGDGFWSSKSNTPTLDADAPTLPPPLRMASRPAPAPLATLAPVMVPMKDSDGPHAPFMTEGDNRYSQMSFQSAAYSFYDLESPGPSTPRTSTPTQNTLASSSAEVGASVLTSSYGSASSSRIKDSRGSTVGLCSEGNDIPSRNIPQGVGIKARKGKSHSRASYE